MSIIFFSTPTDDSCFILSKKNYCSKTRLLIFCKLINNKHVEPVFIRIEI